MQVKHQGSAVSTALRPQNTSHFHFTMLASLVMTPFVGPVTQIRTDILVTDALQSARWFDSLVEHQHILSFHRSNSASLTEPRCLAADRPIAFPLGCSTSCQQHSETFESSHIRKCLPSSSFLRCLPLQFLSLTLRLRTIICTHSVCHSYPALWKLFAPPGHLALAAGNQTRW